MTTLLGRILHPTWRLKAAVVGLLVSSAALTLNAQPASAYTKYWSIRYDARNFVLPYSSPFICSYPGAIGVNQVYVTVPSNFPVVQVTEMLYWKKYTSAGWPQNWDGAFPTKANGFIGGPGSHMTFPQGWVQPGPGAYYFDLQVQFHDAYNGGTLAQVDITPTVASDFTGYGQAGYCYIH